MGADARPRPGTLDSGKQGASRAAPCGGVDWVQTLLQGRPRQRNDLAFKTRRSTAPQVWLVIVDASASTRRHHALTDAKGVLAEVFEDAYRQRARVAVMTASGLGPQWHVSGIKAAKGLEHWLQGLGAGGGTPLLEAVSQASEWLKTRRRRFPLEEQRVLLLTDGRLKAWRTQPTLECPGLLIDMERGPIRLGRARQIASDLHIEYRHLDELQTL